MKKNDSVSCETVLGSETCGIEGSAKEMYYSRLPTGKVIVTCPTCTEQLSVGFKAGGQPFCSATIAAIRGLAGFEIELVTGLEIHAGHCSFRACDRELDAGDEMVLRSGDQYRRLCGNCSAALTIISTDATCQLERHNAGERLSKRDLKTVERQAKLVPETMRVALKAIETLKEQARARTEAAKQLAMAQLGKVPLVTASAQPAPAPKADREPSPNFGKKYQVLVEVYGLDKGLFTEALQRAHAAKTMILDEVRKTKEGIAAIERRNTVIEMERKLAALPADVVGRFKRPGSVALRLNRTMGFISAREQWFIGLADRSVKAAPVTTSKPVSAGNQDPLTFSPFTGLTDAVPPTPPPQSSAS
jgi:3,4-dihydroxy-2-butanone 4-phosphate synthase